MVRPCDQCGNVTVHYAKGLCSDCYRISRNPHLATRGKSPKYKAEQEFVSAFFDHDDWIYEPTSFSLKGIKYTPDFLDKRRDVYIEVVGSKQAYHQNKAKYVLLRLLFPKIKFEVRNRDGSIHQD